MTLLHTVGSTVLVTDVAAGPGDDGADILTGSSGPNVLDGGTARF
ncbi:hypothetical protein KZZ52_06610 [Dactylosporangium sp. AC04546]|nr:hypothetical protein [Dactylosporangium sp. AC04546]WVK85067.1 hypothetical protein KZZ52_06610 [Dactylosporangium sp. AC04546]